VSNPSQQALRAKPGRLLHMLTRASSQPVLVEQPRVRCPSRQLTLLLQILTPIMAPTMPVRNRELVNSCMRQGSSGPQQQQQQQQQGEAQYQ